VEREGSERDLERVAKEKTVGWMPIFIGGGHTQTLCLCVQSPSTTSFIKHLLYTSPVQIHSDWQKQKTWIWSPLRWENGMWAIYICGLPYTLEETDNRTL
jgi:hypothetical protein